MSNGKQVLIELTNGLTLAGLSWGDESLPKLLALHGWLDNSATYVNMAQTLGKHFNLVAIDLAGHGLSSHRPEGVRYHLLDNVDDVIQCANALGWDTFYLMGHSMGAGIATYVTASFPERVKKLVLLEGVGTHATEVDQAPATLHKAVKDMLRAPLTKKPIYESLEAAITARTSVIGSISREAASILCERGTHVVEGGITWSSDPRLRMTSAMRLTESLVQAFLEHIECQTLFIGAEQGMWQRMSSLEKRLQLIPQLSHETLPGNHHNHLEPETYQLVADAVLNFLLSGD